MKSIKIMVGYAVILGSLLSLSGCASIFGDNSRHVMVKSAPPGASVYVDGQRYGNTPAMVTLPSYIYGGKAITVRKEGYQDQTIMVNTKFQPITLLDILFWPSLIVDAVTGDMVKVDPASLNLDYDLQRT